MKFVKSANGWNKQKSKVRGLRESSLGMSNILNCFGISFSHCLKDYFNQEGCYDRIIWQKKKKKKKLEQEISWIFWNFLDRSWSHVPRSLCSVIFLKGACVYSQDGGKTSKLTKLLLSLIFTMAQIRETIEALCTVLSSQSTTQVSAEGVERRRNGRPWKWRKRYL